MYVIKADYAASGIWENLYYQGDPDYAAWNIECSLQMGDSGSVSLTVPLSHPEISRIITRKTLLDFQVDGTSLGVFEVREITHDIMGNAEIYAVGELAWLFDSVQPQAEYHDQTVRGFLQTLLAVHNTQCPEHQFVVGTVDVTDSNDSLYRYTNREQTLACIRDKLVDRLGGNLRVRRSGGARYLDYVTDQTYGSESEQTIRFGENILDYSDNFTVDDICSEVIPLGARLENDKGDNSNIGNLEKRLTIESVNDGADYISDSGLVARFGHIRTTCTWDDVTVPANLLAKAKSWLSSEQFEKMHISVQAVDLSLSDKQFGALRMGDMPLVICEHMGLKKRFVIRARTYHPDEPDTDSIELGDDTQLSFVKSQVGAITATAAAATEHEHVQAQWLTEAIENVTAMMTGNRGGYKLTEYDEDGRWLADYVMDSMDKSTARIVKKTTVDGTAYSTNGIDGPYETAITAAGTIIGKFLQANSVRAEAISTDYTSLWEDADTNTLMQARTEFQAGDAEIAARVTATETSIGNVKTDLAAEVKVRADQIAQTVKRGQINSTIKQTAETIYIESNKFGWNSTNSQLATDGTLTAKKAVLNDCDINGRLALGGTNNKNGYAWVYDYNNKRTMSISNNGISVVHPDDTASTIARAAKGNHYYLGIYGTSSSRGSATRHVGFDGYITLGNYSKGEDYYDILGVGENRLLNSLWVGWTLKVGDANKNKGNINGAIWCYQLTAQQNGYGRVVADRLSVSGTKSRTVETDNYSNRLLYCYETPSPMFGDIGSGTIDEEGICYVEIDDVFAETVRTDMDYQVFLQKCGQGDLWVDEKTPTYFVVRGTPGLPFDWEMKAHQLGYEYERIEQDGMEYEPERKEQDETA